MSKFGLKEITAIKGKQKFFQLTIDDNPIFDEKDTDEVKNEKKTGVLDTYSENLEEKYKKDLVSIYSYMQQIAENKHLPGVKYHELNKRPKNDAVKDYEFKKGDLRVYCFKTEDGKIIAYGGFKNSQKEDIQKFRGIKKEYLDSLKK